MKKIVLLLTVFLIIVYLSALYVNKELENTNYYNIIEIKETEQMIKTEEEIVIYFYKLDCHPCSLFKGTLNSVIKENMYDIKAVNIMESSKINVAFNNRYNIKVTPTVVRFANGVEIDRVEGNIDKEQLILFLNKEF